MQVLCHHGYEMGAFRVGQTQSTGDSIHHGGAHFVMTMESDPAGGVIISARGRFTHIVEQGRQF